MRILSLVHPGTNSRGLLFDIAAGFEALNHPVLHFELGPLWQLRENHPTTDDAVGKATAGVLAEFIRRNGVELSIALWSSGTLSVPVFRRADGKLQSLWDEIERPHLHYWWDAPHWFNNGSTLPLLATGLFGGPYQLHAVNNVFTATEMERLMGFANVIPCPNGVNPERFRPLPGAKPEYDLIFLSGGGDPPPTPIMLEELQRDEPDVERIRRDVASRLGPELDRVAARFPEPRRATARRLLDTMVEIRLNDRHLPALEQVRRAAHTRIELAEIALELMRNPQIYVDATATVRTIETWERPFLVAYLGRFFRCLRLGNQAYDAWGLTGDAIGAVPYDEQPAAYARARAALNVMRWQDDSSLNSKVFEITACGRVCVQAHRAGLDDLFDAGRELLVFRSPGEARQKLADLLRSDSACEELAARGRARTLAAHTWAHRMRPIVEAARRTGSNAPGAPATRPPPSALPPSARTPTPGPASAPA